MYKASAIIASVTVPWTLFVALLFAVAFSARTPGLDRVVVLAGSQACWLPALVLVPPASVTGVVLALLALRTNATRRWRAGLIAVANALVASAYLPLGALLIAPWLLTGLWPVPSEPPRALGSLVKAVPYSWTADRQYISLSHFTADELNRSRHGWDHLARITYVSADAPSTGPLIVSVNPIGDHTWGAAALSARTHRCYLVLFISDPTNLHYQTMRYGQLPEGAPCLGAAAAPETVTSSRSPDE